MSLPHSTAPLAIALALALGSSLAAPPLAHASSPMSTFVVPTRVDYFPDKASATSVAIHGAFLFWVDGQPTYSAPACGYLYFNCSGDGKTQTMCRMQWEQIEQAIGNRTTCTGFGQLNMKPVGTLRAEGTPLGTPDSWDLGMGVQGASVGGLIQQCASAQALSCAAQPIPDGGTTADLATGRPPQPAPSSGCGVMGRAASSSGLVPLGAVLALLWGWRRRAAGHLP